MSGVEAMAELTYRQATILDLELLVRTRLLILRTIKQLDETADLSAHEPHIRCYYQRVLADGSHIAYLVFDGERFVGAGGMSFYQVMPSYENPTGNIAYIMNIYTAPAYRRRGVAWHTLDLLVGDARARGVTAITLDATAMGRPLYKKYGFVPMDGEMELSVF